MSIIIKGSSNGATFTVTQNGVTIPYTTGTAYSGYEKYNNTGTMVCTLRMNSTNSIILQGEPGNIINGDTSTPFNDYTSFEAYCVANIFGSPLNNSSIFNTKSSPKTFTDASIASGNGVSVQIAIANSLGYGIQIFNPSLNSIVWINNTGDTASANTAGNFPLSPGGYYEERLTNAVTALVANGQPLTIKIY